MKHRLYLRILLTGIMTINFLLAFNQSITYPAPVVDQSAISVGPNATGFENAGNAPFSFYQGIPAINIPITEVSCGSISLPISLSYYYNGFRPLQDASWVGLGWNLNAGGLITASVQHLPDSSYASGYNYGQYSIYAGLFGGTDPQGFLQKSYFAYTNSLSNYYDLAPDIYEANFGEGSFKFYWYNGKAYMFPYAKGMSISRPSVNSSFTITSPNGNQYIFGAREFTTTFVGPGDFSTYNTSAWNLTSIISADKKDTITLKYGSYQWSQFHTPYSYTYVVAASGASYLASSTYSRAPVVQGQYLQSVSSRNTTVNFIPSSAGRLDINGTLPSLQEIDVIDKLTGRIIKKEILSYEYLGHINGDPSASSYERLNLKQIKTVNPYNASDSQAYRFKYLREYDTTSIRPFKGTLGIDFWGFYNGKDDNTDLLSIVGLAPKIANRNPDSTASLGINGGSYIGYGALDTVFYPTGGFTAYHYTNNYYQDASNQTRLAPGICVDSVKNFTGASTTPATTIIYSYGLGDLFNPPNFNGPTFTGGSTAYNTFNAYNYASGRNVLGGIFYYPYVKEYRSAGTEIHRTDYSFSNFSSLLPDISMTGKKEYVYNPTGNTFTLLTNKSYNFVTVTDTSFLTASPYLQSSNVSGGVTTNNYSFSYNYQNTYWKYLSSESSTIYDVQGNSISTSVNYSYNAQRNMITSTQTLADGKSVIQKFKYPESYTSNLTGNMVTSNVVSPVIEKQNWMQYGSGSPVFIGGSIAIYDQTKFKPTATYNFETTVPVGSLNNETSSGGFYTSLLSDSRYIQRGSIQYDADNNISMASQVPDLTISYLYDYNHAYQVAQVKNASQSDIAYCSFEAEGKGNWNFTGAATPYPYAPTGNNAYYLGQNSGNITKSGLLSTTSYIVSYWIKGTTALTVAGTISGYPIQGKTINGWTYFEHKISGQSSVTISGSKYIDELRLYPSSAQMSTSTYLPMTGKTSQCDVDNRITYYDYDGYNRLQDVRDQDRNFIKQICYNYFGQASSCALTAYYNSAVTVTYTKNDCTSPYSGTTVGYTVPANTYSSTLSQSAADQMATNDVNANAQQNANTYGACVLPDPVISCSNLVNYAGFVATYKNTSTNVTYSYTITAAGGTLGTIPAGTYNITITKAPGMNGQMKCSINCNGLSGSSATVVSFSNVGILNNTCNILTINAL